MFGEELKRLRRKAGLTQEEVAARARVTREYVSMLEAKKNSPTIEVFIRLCRAVDSAPADVIARLEQLESSTQGKADVRRRPTAR